jgi:hypothetical protein
VTPDDPRHGQVRGYIAHQRNGGDYCEPCIHAKSVYDKRRKWDALNGRGYTVPSLGARRRVQALQAQGWSRTQIATEAGWGTSGALRYIDRSETITRRTHERIAEAYERLCMKPPPDAMSAIRTRTWARKHGHVPPLSWDDIDADPEPATGEACDLDPVVVDRVLAGRVVPTTHAERLEIARRWIADGRGSNELFRLTGWNIPRYVRVKEVA